MSNLNPATHRRLLALPQVSTIWEGDRCSLGSRESGQILDLGNFENKKDLIIIVDGFEGVVREMELVTPDTGPEAVVRVLLKAMQYPQRPLSAFRPQKIVVRDRELQFYLRGVLQGLGITIEYKHDLPMIDQVIRSFADSNTPTLPMIPVIYQEILQKKALEIWDEAPWDILADYQVICVELNQWDISNLYITVMGMLGMEYGVLIYRSLDSLKQFRASVQSENSLENMESAFLAQDCLFMTYGSQKADNVLDEDHNLSGLFSSDIETNFGSLHPLEGLRDFLYEDEAAILYVGLEAFHRFWKNHKKQFKNLNQFPDLQKQYNIKGPLEKTISVKVMTLPMVAQELFHISDQLDGTKVEHEISLRDDLIPKESHLSLGAISWDSVELLKNKNYTSDKPLLLKGSGDGLAVILVQTDRTKAKNLIEGIKIAGGLKGIGFNPGESVLEGECFDLGIFQTQNGELHLFGEFFEHDAHHLSARKKWEQRCRKHQGRCGLIIAKFGSTKGTPKLQDMMALFEGIMLTPEELGLGLLQLMPDFDDDDD